MRISKEYNTLQIQEFKQFFEMPKEQRKQEHEYLQPMIEDKLFMRTGLQQTQYQILFSELDIGSDPEFQSMHKDFQSAIDALVAASKASDS